MQAYIFRKYDIRGIVGQDFAPEEFYECARAYAAYIRQKKPYAQKIIVGRDGRLHSPQIARFIIKGLRDGGLDVIDIGLSITPVLSYVLHAFPAAGGIMITASHNGPEWNGLKLYNGAVPIFDEAIQEIKAIACEQAFQRATRRGCLVKKSYNAAYVSMLSTLFAHLRGCSMPIVLDCGNAATGPIVQALIKQLDWHDTHLMHAEVDGRYPNHLADPVDERNMQDVAVSLERGSFLCGVGFDGDGDRMGVMMNGGDLISGDKLTGLFGQSIVQHAPQSDVVVDVKCSPVVIDFLHTVSARCHMSATGHAFVRHKLYRIHAVLGGELSCHFFFRDRYFGFDDGIYAALRWCELLTHSGLSAERLVTQFPSSYSSPDLRIACPEEKKHHVVDVLAGIYNARVDASCTSVDGVRFVVPYGWAIIRVSNTQPAISVRFESMTSSGFKRLESELYQNLVSHIDTTVLDEHFC